MKIAIVTGASSGLGREFVKQIGHLYQTLDEIWVIARRGKRLEELQKISGVPIRVLEGDLLKPPVYRNLKSLLEKEKPDIRMLVNGAGFGKSGTVEKILEEDKRIQLQMIDLNCVALSRMTFLCLPWCGSGTRILNIASAAAFCPQPGFAVYAATKSYVLSFSRSLGTELKSRGIYVTAVCPGPVDTEFFRTAGAVTNPIKKLTMARPEWVVRRALLDARAKKPLSVYGFFMKAAALGSRLVPQGLLLSFMNATNKES